MSEEIINFDVIKPQNNQVMIAGKIIDLGKISFDICLDIIRKMDELGKDDKVNLSAVDMVEFFSTELDKIIIEQHPKVDSIWIQKNIGGIRRFKLLNEIIVPLINELTSGSEPEGKKKVNSILGK